MQERQETYGRYCLPVHQDPPFTIHPAFWPAFVAWLFACAIQVTSRHGIIHIGLGVGMTLDLLFMIGAFGLTRLMVWMREDDWRKSRHNRISGNSSG